MLQARLSNVNETFELINTIFNNKTTLIKFKSKNKLEIMVYYNNLYLQDLYYILNSNRYNNIIVKIISNITGDITFSSHVSIIFKKI